MVRSAWLALALVACGGDKGGDSGGADGIEDEAIAADLWEDLQSASSWDQVDAWLGVQPSDTVHDAFTQVWWNDIAFEHVTTGSGDMPVGSIIYKESYTDADGTDRAGITAMYKMDEEYGWFWASYDADGTAKQAGQPGLCTGCHSAGQDSVLTTTW